MFSLTVDSEPKLPETLSPQKGFPFGAKTPAPSSKLSLHWTNTLEVPTPENLSFYLEVSSCFWQAAAPGDVV